MHPETRLEAEAALAELGHPADAAAWVEKGRLLQRLERNTSALLAYDQALALSPDFGPAWHAKALLLDELERTAEALAAYDALLDLQPGHTAVWSNRAGLLLRDGRIGEALESLDRALETDPANDLLALNKGLLLMQGFERPQEAIPWLERAQATGFPEAAEALAMCREALRAAAAAGTLGLRPSAPDGRSPSAASGPAE